MGLMLAPGPGVSRRTPKAFNNLARRNTPGPTTEFSLNPEGFPQSVDSGLCPQLDNVWSIQPFQGRNVGGGIDLAALTRRVTPYAEGVR